MARRSVYTNVTTRVSLPVANRTAAATVNGSSVDRNVGSDMHRSAMVVVFTATITDGTHTIIVQDSDDNSSFTAVADEFLQGTEPAVVAADDDKVFHIGYVGSKRYLRVAVTTAGATTGGSLGALVALGEPRRGPVAHA